MGSTSRQFDVGQILAATGDHGDIELDEAESPALPITGPHSAGRFVDRLPATLVRALTVVSFAIPVGLYLWMVHKFALNVIAVDQFDDVTVIRGSYAHFFDWHQLWAQHNETRILFPNLVAVTLAHIDSFNIVHEEYLSALLLLTAVGLLLGAHKRRSPNVPWLYYSPAVILLLSVVQWQNSLWGFQLAWYLTLISLMAAIFFVDRIELDYLSVAVASLFGIIGSLSLIQGFLIWPVGLFLLYQRNRLRFAVPWLTVGAVTAIIYFRNFDSTLGAPAPNYAILHPWASVRFFVFAAGDIVGVQPNGHDSLSGYPLIVGFGIVLLAIAAWVVAAFGIRRDYVTGTPIGVVLILFATVFALMVTKGRIIFGYAAAGSSRYTTFDLLFLCGIYLAILGRNLERRSTASRVLDAGRSGHHVSPGTPRVARNFRTTSVVCAVAGLLIAVQAAFGLYYGLNGASSWLGFERKVQMTEERASTATGLELAGLYLFAHPPSWVLHQLGTLRMHRLSFYADSGSSLPSLHPRDPGPPPRESTQVHDDRRE